MKINNSFKIFVFIVCLFASELLFAANDTLPNEPAEVVGNFKSLDTFISNGFQLKYSKDLNEIKFRYYYNPNSERGGILGISGIVCIHIKDNWIVYRNYFLHIDSVYCMDLDGFGSPEIFIQNSSNDWTYLREGRFSWSYNQKELVIVNIDSNYIVLRNSFHYFYQKYYDEMDKIGFEFDCSSQYKFVKDQLLVSEYSNQLIGDEIEFKEYNLECPCPNNGSYLLIGNKYIKRNL